MTAQSLRAARSMVMFLAIAASAAICCTHLLADEKQQEEWKAPPRAANRRNPIAADDKSKAAGKNVYISECLSCHGKCGRGDGPDSKDLTHKPHDLASARVTDQTDGALFWKISEGRKPMPSFEKLISEEERWQVINYIRTFSPGPTAKHDSADSARTITMTVPYVAACARPLSLGERRLKIIFPAAVDCILYKDNIYFKNVLISLIFKGK